MLKFAGLLSLFVFLSSLGLQVCYGYKLHGLNFSPYTDGQDPNLGVQISEEQLRERMEIIAPYTEWIRTFGCTNGLEKAGLIAHEMGLKAALAAWLSQDLEANEFEISNLIAAANAGQADMVIVGGEVLLRGDLSESQLVDYINRVKASTNGIPVTYADTYDQILSHPNVISEVDVVLANYYPYWESKRVDVAMHVLHISHQQVIAEAEGKEVIVAETGWPSAGNRMNDAIPSPENSSFYFLNFVSWARANNVPYLYFSGFDEAWKAYHGGPQNAHWGVWTRDGIMKPGMQDVFGGVVLPDNWTFPGGPGDPAIEFTYVPPYGNFDEHLRGQVWHVLPADYEVAVYIYVVTGWWTKPTFANPTTPIRTGGSWVCDIWTGGIDEKATRIAAYLIPNGYDPPQMDGDPELPLELDQNSAAKIEFARMEVTIDPALWDYGNVTVGNFSDRMFNISNASSATLDLTANIISDMDFSIQNGGGDFSLDPGGTHNIGARFEPSSAWPRSATLSFISNGNNMDIPLQGTGAAPDIAIIPLWDYGGVSVGSSSSKTFTVFNPGSATLEVTAINLIGDSNFSILSGGGSFSLNTREIHNIVVCFTPSSAGSKSAILRLFNNVDDRNPLDVLLEGIGMYPAPILQTFAINNGSSSTTSQTVTLNNTAKCSPTHYMASENIDFSGASWLAYSPSASFTLSSGEGMKTVYLKLKNDIGESNVLSDTIEYDAPPPAPVISSDTHGEDIWSNSDAPVFDWTEPPDISGIAGYSYELDNLPTAVPDTVSEGIATSKSYSGVANGTWYFHVRAQDGAGSWGSTDHYGPVNIDTEPPPAPEISSTTHAENVWSSDDGPFFSWTTPSDMSGIIGYSHELDNSPTTIPDTVSESTSISKSYSDVVNGTWYFHIRAQDGAGNWGDVDHYGPVKIDDIPPSAPVASSSTHDEGLCNNNVDPCFSWTEPSDTSGITGYSYELDNSLSTIPDSTSEGDSLSRCYSNVVDGTWYFHVRGVDGAGNWGETEHYGPVKIDTAGPGAPLVSSTTHTEGVWSTNDDPIFNWLEPYDSCDIAGYSYEFDNSPTTIPDTTSEGTDTPKSYNDIADGIWYFHIRAQDGAGNWGSTDHYGTVKIDTTPPENPTNCDETHGVQSGIAQSSDNDPSFTWSGASDNASGVNMYYCYWGSNPNGTSSDYTPVPAYDPPAVSEGTYYLRVKTKDNAGNEASWETLFVFIYATKPDNTAPEISELPDKILNEDESLDNAIDLWAYTEDIETADSGLTFYIIDNTNPDCGVTIDANRYIDINPTANWHGQSDVTIKVTDPGSLNDTDAFSITVDPVNDPPFVTDLMIEPYLPGPEDPLQALYTFDDIDGDTENGSLIKWYRNGEHQPYDNLAVLPTSATSLDEEWCFTATPCDGTDFGDTKTSPSVIIGGLIQELPLHQGWNLISLFVQPPNDEPGIVLSPIDSEYNSVWAYDPDTSWSVYTPNGPSTLTEMKRGQGYWIEMNQTETLVIQGTDPGPEPIHIKGGKWNLVGHNSLSPLPIGSISPSMPDGTCIYTYDSEEEAWLKYFKGGPSFLNDLEFLEAGHGY